VLELGRLVENLEASFVARLEALMPELRAFARGLCRDAALADDLVQDACLKAWTSQEMFDPAQPMRPWLFRILRNEFYMQKRRSWRSVNLEPRLSLRPSKKPPRILRGWNTLSANCQTISATRLS
jgi:RNA polymerase sigma factor (sigma-70 family)